MQIYIEKATAGGGRYFDAYATRAGAAKTITASEAAGLVRSDMWLEYGAGVNIPTSSMPLSPPASRSCAM